MTAKRDKNRIPKGSKRGRKMSEKARHDLARAQSLWDLNPDLTMIRTSYLTGIKITLINEWDRKGYLTRPEAKTPPPPPPVATPQEETEKAGRVTRVDDDEWDTGPVPSIESIRREIKRNLRSRMGDSLMVSQYATALGKLDGIKDREEAAEKEVEDAITIYIPAEDKAPPEPA
jgi:hypothetical protein